MSMSSSGKTAHDAAIAVRPNGVGYIAWTDSRTGVSNVYYRTGSGLGWSTEAAIPSHGLGAQYPALAVGPNGEAHIVWEDLRFAPTKQVFYRRTLGGVWQTEEQLTFEELTDGSEPDIAVGSDGVVHVVWKDERADFGDIYYRSCVNGVWGPEERISAAAKTGRTPKIACDPLGQAHVVWSDNTPSSFAIYYSNRSALGWSLPLQISDGTATAREPSIEIDSDGKVHVVWEDNSPGNYAIFYKSRVPLSGDTPEGLPRLLCGLECAPNPFTNRAVIRLRMNSAQTSGAGAYEPGATTALGSLGAEATLLDILSPDGRRICTLSGIARGEAIEYTWDGCDAHGRPLPAGAYFYAARGAGGAAKKLILAR